MIFDIDKFKCRTLIEQINTLFKMCQELEQEVNDLKEQLNGGN